MKDLMGFLLLALIVGLLAVAVSRVEVKFNKKLEALRVEFYNYGARLDRVEGMCFKEIVQ